MTDDLSRYSSARRLHQVKAYLQSSGGASVYDVIERFAISRSSALRYLKALEEAGEPLVEEVVGKTKRYRILATARTATLRLSTAEMVALSLATRVFDFLEGTGFKEDLDQVLETLTTTLKAADFAMAKNLEKKLVVVNEARRDYAGRTDDVDDLLTALLREERLDVTHASVKAGGVRFGFEPYSLLVHRGGLYFTGMSAHHRAVRTFALDGFSEVSRRRGETFEYPEDFDPRALLGDAFGIIRGERTRVSVWFSAKVAKFVKRRAAHATQTIEERPDGSIVWSRDVDGTDELSTWVLGFGEHAEVLGPESLRRGVREVVERMRGRYAEASST
jgi:proteasome accessory factor B